MPDEEATQTHRPGLSLKPLTGHENTYLFFIASVWWMGCVRDIVNLSSGGWKNRQQQYEWVKGHDGCTAGWETLHICSSFWGFLLFVFQPWRSFRYLKLSKGINTRKICVLVLIDECGECATALSCNSSKGWSQCFS